MPTLIHPTDDLDLRSAELALRCRDLPAPLRLRWRDRPVLLAERGRPWLYGPARRDPMAVDGRSVLPAAQARRLRRFVEAGVPVQEVAIAHELDPHGPVARLLPTLEQGPRTCTDDVARALVGPVPPHPAVARTVGLLDRVVRRTARTTAEGSRLLLDPVVFGVVGCDRLADGDPALFYPLAVWRW